MIAHVTGRGFSRASIEGTLQPADGRRIAEAVLNARYPQADFAFVAGSIVRGQGAPLSDIDLVVLHAALPSGAWRESFLHDGVPIEAFVHDPGTLRWFFRSDRQSGHPQIIDMVAHGEVIGLRPQRAQSLWKLANLLLAQGPPPLGVEQLDLLRYRLTDLADDLAAKRPVEELMAIGASLYHLLAEFMLRTRGVWSAAGKWIPRNLAKADPDAAAEFAAAFDALFRGGDAEGVLRMLARELAQHGGFLFDGYRRPAKPEWRIDTDEAVLS
jgi:hypothetical protein